MQVRFTLFVKSLLIVGILFPLAYLLVLSVAENWSFPQLVPENISFERWLSVSSSKDLFTSLGFSLVISICVAFFSTLLGFITSRYVARSSKREWLILLAYLPYVLSPVIYAALLYIYFVRFGLSGNMIGVIIGQLIIAYPYSIIIFSGFWNNQLIKYEELATTLGSNVGYTFRKVLLPMAKGILMICFFQTFLISWFEYGLTSLIGVGKVQTLTVKVFQFISEADFYYAAFSSCMLIFPPLVLLWFNKRYVYSKLT